MAETLETSRGLRLPSETGHTGLVCAMQDWDTGGHGP